MSLARVFAPLCIGLLAGVGCDASSPQETNLESGSPDASGGAMSDAGGDSVEDTAAHPGFADAEAEAPAEPTDGADASDDGGGSTVADASGADAGRDATSSLPARVLLYYLGAVPTISSQSIMAQLAFYAQTLTGWGFASDQSVDPTTISDSNLQHYAALAMVNTCFAPFGMGQPDTPQSQAIQAFLRRGGGLFGTHCADVTFAGQNPPALYNQLIGGRGGNGFFQGQNNCRKLADHPSTAALAATFSFTGNLDNTDFLAADSTVLVKCTWVTPNGADVNVSWYRTEGAGRVFYTDFAKVEGDLHDPVIGPHVTAGLSWVLQR
jgi:uncharacterized protein